MKPSTREEITRAAIESRRAQGLPDTITSDRVLGLMAALYMARRGHDIEAAHMRKSRTSRSGPTDTHVTTRRQSEGRRDFT